MTERNLWMKERRECSVACIDINGLTKDYGQGHGIFDLTLSVEEGETFGFVGINGAGKTTTIRHLMGFLNPESGRATIRGMDCWREAAKIKRLVGYIPGEISFPDAETGDIFLKRQLEMQRGSDMEYCRYICDKLQLDTTADLKRMSKGMKQKTAIAAAFMNSPDILILDEPTTGLDPLMRDNFIDLIKEQKAMGHTVFMSSHIFEEIEVTCDRVALIKGGELVAVTSMNEIRHSQNKTYKIEFKDEESYRRFTALNYQTVAVKPNQLQVTIDVNDSQIGKLMRDLKDCNVLFFKEVKHSLEEYFHHVFKEEK